MTERLTRFRWERLVISDRGPVNPITRLVLLVLATHLNRDNEAWPSEKVLASKTGLSQRAVFTHLQIAVSEGWIERTASRGQGKAWALYTYRIRTPSDGLGTAPRAPPKQQQGAEGRATPTGEGTAPGAEGTARHADGTAPDDSLVRHQVRTNIEVITSKNTSENIPAKPAPSKEGDGEHSKGNVKSETPKSKGGLEDWARVHGYEQLPGESEPDFKRRMTEKWLPSVAGKA